MAIQSPFFGNKRELDNTPGVRPAGMPQTRGLGTGTAGGVSHSATSATATPQETPAAALSGAASPAPAAVGASFASSASEVREGGSRLTVGPNIKLKGVEITDCDTLFVEGMVEATMDSRLMQIAEGGAFKGSADIDIAEIRGDFDGNLTVREKLVIHATGKVTGTVRYGKLIVEEGGQMSGDIQFGSKSVAAQARTPALEGKALQAA